MVVHGGEEQGQQQAEGNQALESTQVLTNSKTLSQQAVRAEADEVRLGFWNGKKKS